MKIVVMEDGTLVCAYEDDQTELAIEHSVREGNLRNMRCSVMNVPKFEFTAEHYPYRYRGNYYNLHETQRVLVEEGYEVVGYMDELEFSQYLFERQNQHDPELSLNWQGPEPIPFLEERYLCIYRGGERSKHVYTAMISEATEIACGEYEHLDKWVVDDEE